MRTLLSIISLLLIASCGLSPEEKEKVAAVTCSIMGETTHMDGAVRVREINEARERIGGEPFLNGDAAIKIAFEWGLCEELVLNENYEEKLQEYKDAKQALEERLAAEQERLAAEQERLAAARFANAKLNPEAFFIGVWKRVDYPMRLNFKAKNVFSSGNGDNEARYQGRWKVDVVDDLFHFELVFFDTLLDPQLEKRSLTIVEVLSANEFQQGMGESPSKRRPLNFSEAIYVNPYTRE